MFLKRIEAYGFKSFADKTIIEFENGITGVVGPNGCGKSNIADAIRWVLGEQSAKSLRGSHMSDIIFAGSENRKPLGLAEVTLVFDNTNHLLPIEYAEVQVTRRLFRSNNESEYLLNGQNCRLKDIADLVMDTGLGKDSLSIISQGNISRFADSKPEERRLFFEEAAGVLKYKKRKQESLRKLERTQDHLDRIKDILFELERQVGPLAKQAEKAKAYLSYKETLQTTEVSLIVQEVSGYHESLEQIKQALETQQYNLLTQESELSINEARQEKTKQAMHELDLDINELQGQLVQVMSELNQISVQKAEMDERMKVTQNKEDIDGRVALLKKDLEEHLFELQSKEERLQKQEASLSELLSQRQMIQDEMETYQETAQDLQNKLNQLDHKKQWLQQMMSQKGQYPQGVRSILDAKNVLYGVEGTIDQVIEIEPTYQLAITTSLGSSMNFVVMKTVEATKDAIAYLKQHKAGRATFLPLDRIQARHMPSDVLTILASMPGYLGIASSFVKNTQHIQPAIDQLLGQVIVASHIDDATNISKMVYGRYKIVTLEGDVVHVGGSLTGGSYKNAQQNYKEELDQLEAKGPVLGKQYQSCKQKAADLSDELSGIATTQIQKQVSVAKLREEIQEKKQAIQLVKNEYEALTHEQFDDQSVMVDHQLLTQIEEKTTIKDDMIETIKIKRERRLSWLNESQTIELDAKALRMEINQVKRQIHELELDQIKYQQEMEHMLTRLGQEYQLTFEFAKEQAQPLDDFEQAKSMVLELRQKIQKLGYVNLEAIEEYETVKERFDFLSEQKEDLDQARYDLLEAINEMDKQMEKQFVDMFEQVNRNFDDVFKQLFGGGHALLKYTDPTNILETGIDIEVQPPGKTIQNISLFSGGEKALIAISCLFAILKAKPIPLCILDEVEAALDAVNVERFAKYLKNFSLDTQFIVVTHRSGTMEECDLLYGVTMQEQGITRMFSVMLEDAKQLSTEGSA